MRRKEVVEEREEVVEEGREGRKNWTMVYVVIVVCRDVVGHRLGEATVSTGHSLAGIVLAYGDRQGRHGDQRRRLRTTSCSPTNYSNYSANQSDKLITRAG